MPGELKKQKHVIKVDGLKEELVLYRDEDGRVLHKVINPILYDFNPRDILQVIVGATLLAVPVGYTEETWRLSESLPVSNVVFVMLISLVFISAFTFHTYYHDRLKKYTFKFVTRVLSTYMISFLVVATFLTLIQAAPWDTNLLVTIKRIILVSFPASMSASVADIINK